MLSCLTILQDWVLNLVINGLPSIPYLLANVFNTSESFKPCYKWITFNTMEVYKMEDLKNFGGVLNLVINGLPSILWYI